ncbi:MAG: hypothetical protein GQ565_05190 [Candidatus Aegiribacteria sp.]|nr:hypothetical protein [Candidatus Aegiribacteria sp.]
MERFLFVLLLPQPKWELDAMVTEQKEMQKVRNIMDELRGEKKGRRGN